MILRLWIVQITLALCCVLGLVGCSGDGSGESGSTDADSDSDSDSDSDPIECTTPITFTEHIITDDCSVSSIHAADLDGDSDMDVLSAEYWSDSIKWWENTASDGASWTEHTIDGAFYGAESVHAADLDGDSDMDVLGAASDADEITWWENTEGDGSSWTEHIVDGSFGWASEVFAADLDGDSDLDVLGAANSIRWWENTAGDGSSWTEHTIDYFAEATESVYAADLDGDSDLDVLEAESEAHYIIWWENAEGDGVTWTEHIIDNFFHEAMSVYASDLDGDSDMDVLGAANHANCIAYWENMEGNGSSWTEHTIDNALPNAASVYAADLDEDADFDVFGAGWGGEGVIRWFENTEGNGSSWTPHTIDEEFIGAHLVHVVDLDGDSDLDVLGGTASIDNINWWENSCVP